VLLAAIILALLLGLTCASLVLLSVANTTASQESIRRAVALSVAEIGVERSKANIVNGVWSGQFASHNHQATASGEAYTPDARLYGSYAVHVTENYGGVSGQYLVISQGACGRATRQVNVVLRRVPPTIPDLLAAITLYNPNALASFRGTPPNVCGLDTNLPSSIPFSSVKASDCVKGSGDGPDAVGIGVHDDASVVDIIAALGKRTSCVSGTDGHGGSQYPSVYNVTATNPTGRVDTLTAADIVEIAAGYETAADYVYDGSSWYDGQGHPASDGNFGSTASPKVIVVRGPSSSRLHLSGCLVGVGLMIIDSEVEFTGTFNYAGLVVITRQGDATVSVEMMGTPLVMGSIIAANPGSESTSILDLRGTADVLYSRQGLAYAQQALANNAQFETVFYMEKKPNAADLEIH
jgi:hypothetical protein